MLHLRPFWVQLTALLRSGARFGLRSRAQPVCCSFHSCTRAIMAALPRWEKCWSSYNLTSFLTWMGHYASEVEKEEAMQLFTVDHRRGVPAWLVARGVIPEEVPLQVTVGGVKVDFPKRPCQEPGCERCITGRGGYQFRWVDARWTPTAALDLSLNPQEVQVEMYKPWPRGLLPIPRDRMAPPGPSPASSSSPTATISSLGLEPAAWNLRAIPVPAVAPVAASGAEPAAPKAAAPRRRKGARRQ